MGIRSRGARRTAVIAIAMASALLGALLAPTAGGAATAAKIGNPGPPVPGVGINSKAALAGPNCDASSERIKIVFLTRPPCVTPWKEGKNNGGATATGVTKDSVKVVVYAQTDEQNQAGPTSARAVNRQTNGPGELSQSFKDWLAVYENTAFETYGRKVDLEIVNPSGTDEAAQRADAVSIVAKKPFFVVDTIGLPVFAAAVAASKTLVNSNSGTPADWKKQAPYRWASIDPDGTPYYGGQFVKSSLLGKPAQHAGDSALQTKTRKFGIVYPDSGVSIDLFTKQLPKNSYVTYSYNVPIDTAQVTSSLQTQAASLIPKMKSDGITSVVLFGSTNVAIPMTAAATSQGYSPEWVLPGTLGIDVSVTARGIDQTQWAHAFGIGQLFPPIVGSSLNQNTALFNWYWGTNNGTYQSGGTGFFNILFVGMSLAGPKLTPQTFQQGLFSMAANGGAATGNTQNYMTAYGKAAGLPYDEYAGLGYDYYFYWWDPTSVGVSNIAAVNGTGRYAYLNDAGRFASGTWPKGEQKFFDKSASIYEETTSTTPTAGQATLPAPDVLPSFPCDGCPSSNAAAK